MTKRRKFLLGMGSLAAGGAAAMGSGAFSSVSANRDATVEVAGDKSAYLKLESTSAYAIDDTGANGGQIAFDFSGGTGPQRGSGVNTRAETCFDDVFAVKNQGTQGVYVWIARTNPDSGGAESVQLGAGHENSVGTSQSDNSAVNIGQYENKGTVNGQKVSNNGCELLPGGWIYLQPGEEAGVDISFFVASNIGSWDKEWQINASVDEPTDTITDYKDSDLTGHS